MLAMNRVSVLSVSQEAPIKREGHTLLLCFSWFVWEKVGEHTMGMGADISRASLLQDFPTGCSGVSRMCFPTASKTGLPVFWSPSWMPVIHFSLPFVNRLNQPVWVYHGKTEDNRFPGEHRRETCWPSRPLLLGCLV